MLTKQETAVRSAQTVSFLRAVAALEDDPAVRCGDYLANKLLDNKYKLLLRTIPQRLLKGLIHLRAPGAYCSMISRTKHFDQTLTNELNCGVKQVVLLGAGYDTRLYRFTDNLRNARVFEVDLPGTQLTKRKRLMEVFRVIPDNITFVPVDFNEEVFEMALLKKGFSPDLKTLFLWEGVSYYLPEKAVQNVLKFVGACGPGSSILFDYAIKDFVNGDQSTYGGKQFARWLKKIKEPFLFGLDAGEIKGFLHNCKLWLDADYGPEECERMYLCTSKGRLFGKTVGHFRVAHARVM